MNNDMSWLGLYKRGIKLQWRFKDGNVWHDVFGKVTFTVAENMPLVFRYKHSIQ